MSIVHVLVDMLAIPATFAFVSAGWLHLKVRSARLDQPLHWDLADVLAAIAGALLVAPWAALAAPELTLIRLAGPVAATAWGLMLFYIWLSIGAECEGWLDTPESLTPVAERIRE